jgi:hypothetical protein
MGVGKYVDFLRFMWNNQIVGYDANIRRALFARFTEWLRRPAGYRETWAGTILAFIYEKVFWRSELGLQDRLLYYAFAGMILVLAMLLAYVAVYVARWSIAAAWRVWLSPLTYSVPQEAEFYMRFRRRAESLGLARPGHQTPAEYADELAQRFTVFREAPELVRAYYDVVFGRRAVPPDRRARIEAFLRSLRGISPSQLRAGTRATTMATG